MATSRSRRLSVVWLPEEEKSVVVREAGSPVASPIRIEEKEESVADEPPSLMFCLAAAARARWEEAERRGWGCLSPSHIVASLPIPPRVSHATALILDSDTAILLPGVAWKRLQLPCTLRTSEKREVTAAVGRLDSTPVEVVGRVGTIDLLRRRDEEEGEKEGRPLISVAHPTPTQHRRRARHNSLSNPRV